MTTCVAIDRVRETLGAVVGETPEVGLQVAACLDGELVIDESAGLADPISGRPVDGETLFMLSSTGKGVAATCLLVCLERHEVSCDLPIAEVWPEFAANGKDVVTIRDALCHRSGVPQTPVGYTPDWLTDWGRMCDGIADLKPMFPPGAATAYHSLTFGYIVGEMLRRIDGRPIDRFLQDEICRPFGIDGAYFGVPDDQMHRVAVLVDAPPAPPEHIERMVGEPACCDVAAVFNRRAVLQACIPGSGGVFNARSLARHYAMLMGPVERSGRRLLSDAHIREATRLQSHDTDSIYRVRIRRGLGYRLGIDAGPLASTAAFGHVGGGGSFAYADPARRLSIAFAKNYFVYRTAVAAPDGPPPTSAAQVVAQAVFQALGLEEGSAPLASAFQPGNQGRA